MLLFINLFIVSYPVLSTSNSIRSCWKEVLNCKRDSDALLTIPNRDANECKLECQTYEKVCYVVHLIINYFRIITYI